ncbi:MAG: 6-pyruvoyl-tetrahydropterin synthase-related protein, partial [Pyrinomonadaceae bacterium]
MPKNLTRSFLSAGVAALAGFVALLPAIVRGIPANNDLPNHLRLALPFYNAIQAGHLYPGWALEVNHSFGDPSFRFYPPALYYLLAATRALMGSWYAGFLVAFVLLSILASLGAYFWAKGFLPKNLAACAGVLYAFVPYHINEFYGASLLAEYTAAAVLPFAFGFVLRVCKDGSARNIAGLALSFALLILSNLPLAVIGSLSLAFYAILTIEKGKSRQTFLRLCLAVGLGLAASAIYWTTMIAEMSWIIKADLNATAQMIDYFDYRKNFVLSPFNLGNSNSAVTLV